MNRLGVLFLACLFISYLGLGLCTERPVWARTAFSSQHYMEDLREAGKRLDLSSSYQPTLRIDPPSLSPEKRLGDCDFYEDFLKLIGIERANAVEAKIRGLSLEEANQFIHRYGERLKEQNRWSRETANKLDFFQSHISDPINAETHCHVQSKP